MRHIVPYLKLFYDTAKYFRGNIEIAILEIGVGRGHSTNHFLSGISSRKNKKGMLYSIDVTPQCKDRVKAPLTQFWRFIFGDSTVKETMDHLRGIEFDVLLIDGNHLYSIVREDFENYVPLVKSGGLVFMHDVLVPRYGVKDFWKEITMPKAILPLSGAGLGVINT